MANHELRGTDPFNTWRERIVMDIQPCGGFYHSGYPIILSYGELIKQNKSNGCETKNEATFKSYFKAITK